MSDRRCADAEEICQSRETHIEGLLVDGTSVQLPEPEVEQASGYAEIMCDVFYADAAAGVGRYEVDGAFDKSRCGQDGTCRFAFDNLVSRDANDVLSVLVAMAHQAVEGLRRAIADLREVRLKRGDARTDAFAEDAVVVTAKDHDVARDAQPAAEAGVDRVVSEKVVGGEKGDRPGKLLKSKHQLVRGTFYGDDLGGVGQCCTIGDKTFRCPG